MSWGFCCGDGWFDLVWTLSQKIEEAASAAGLEQESNEWPEATQVKEKFGSLRFRLKFSPLTMSDEVAALIGEARAISEITCEECGKLASAAGRHGGGQTRCKDHAKEFSGSCDISHSHHR